MSERERSRIYAEYYGHQSTDTHDVMRLYKQEGRFSSREIRFIFGALQKAAQRLGSIIVARDSRLRTTSTNYARPYMDPVVGVVRQESGNPLMGQISGLVVDQDYRGLEIPELIVPPAEREIYDLGFNEAELYVEANDPNAHPEAWRRKYWRDHHGYEDSIASSWMRKLLKDANGNCIHPPNDFEAPAPEAKKAFGMIFSRLAVKEFQTEPDLILHNDTIDNFNEAALESGIEQLNGLELSMDQRPHPTPWQYVYSQYNQRAADDDSDPVRRWTRIKTTDRSYSILYLQEHAWGRRGDELHGRHMQEVSKGYFVVRFLRYPALRDYDFTAINFDGDTIRECTQTETNFILKSLALSAYTFSHDPESTVRSHRGANQQYPTLWTP